MSWPVAVWLLWAALAVGGVASAVAVYHAVKARSSAERAKANLSRKCPLCNRLVLAGEAQSNGNHNLCLLALEIGHDYQFCTCTGWDDPYLAGLEIERFREWALERGRAAE